MELGQGQNLVGLVEVAAVCAVTPLLKAIAAKVDDNGRRVGDIEADRIVSDEAVMLAAVESRLHRVETMLGQLLVLRRAGA